MSTNYARRSSAPASEHNLGLRTVEAPSRVTKADRESNAVVLGSAEPPEGRYSTVVRQNYLHGKQAPTPGVAPVGLPATQQLDEERKGRSKAMKQKNFPFGYEGVALPIISEAQGAQQSAVDLRERERMSRRDAPSPFPYTSIDRSASGTPTVHGSDIQAHMDRMRSSSVFATGVARTTPTSTQRGSYASHDAAQVAQQRSDAARLRKVQTQTSWCTGHERSDWKSVKEATMMGSHGQPARLSSQNQATCVNIGSPAVTVQSTMKTLKQVDFVPHHASPTPPPSFSAHEDHLVLGYRPRDVNSTSRVSYTPTQFTQPSHSAESHVREFRA